MNLLGSHYTEITHAHPVPAASLDRPTISLIGLDKPGVVAIACLARLGFRAVGVDIAADKVADLAAGRIGVTEPRLAELVADGVDRGRIGATQNLIAAVLESDVTIVATEPVRLADGEYDLTPVRRACAAVGQALAMKQSFHIVILRCSLPPRATAQVIAAEIERASGLRMGLGFGLCFDAGSTRDGSAVNDFLAPSQTVVGVSDQRTESIVARIYGRVDDKPRFVALEVAEILRLAAHVWQATTLAFASEIGRMCEASGVDHRDVVGAMARNAALTHALRDMGSIATLGGPVLAAEVRSMRRLGKEHGVEMPVIESIARSNERQITAAIETLEPYLSKRIGFLGVTYRAGTSDLSESPALELMARLRRMGAEVVAHDPALPRGSELALQCAQIRGARPGQGRLLDEIEGLMQPDPASLLAACDVVVVMHATDEFRRALLAGPSRIHVVDLAHALPGTRQTAADRRAAQ